MVDRFDSVEAETLLGGATYKQSDATLSHKISTFGNSVRSLAIVPTIPTVNIGPKDQTMVETAWAPDNLLIAK